MLKVNFEAFVWYRPKGSDNRFHWSDETDPLLWAGGRGYEEYTPAANPALFRAFATLGDDRGRILAFANKFGLLVGRSADDIKRRALQPGDDWPLSAVDMKCHGPSTFRLDGAAPPQ